VATRGRTCGNYIREKAASRQVGSGGGDGGGGRGPCPQLTALVITRTQVEDRGQSPTNNGQQDMDNRPDRNEYSCLRDLTNVSCTFIIVIQL
jgi:hypothetical protein